MRLFVLTILGLCAAFTVARTVQPLAGKPNLTGKNGIRVGRTQVKSGDTVQVKPRDIMSSTGKLFTIQFMVDITNQSKAPVTRNFFVRLNSGVLINVAQEVTPMAPGETRRITFRGQFTSGKHRLTAYIDDGNMIAETDERDNVVSVLCVVP